QTPASDRDLELNLAQPDFSLVALPTTLRLPKYKSAFRVTHRFLRSLGQGSFGNLSSDFFGFDNGAQIGLEFRFGIRPGTQIGVFRTSDRIVEFFAEQTILSQSESFPFAVTSLWVAEGTNNFRDSYAPVVGAVVSRTLGDYLALYAEPAWV